MDLKAECLEHLQRSELCESVTLPRDYWREFLGRVLAYAAAQEAEGRAMRAEIERIIRVNKVELEEANTSDIANAAIKAYVEHLESLLAPPPGI